MGWDGIECVCMNSIELICYALIIGAVSMRKMSNALDVTYCCEKLSREEQTISCCLHSSLRQIRF